MKAYHFGAAVALLAGGLASPVQAQGIPFGGPGYQPPVPPIINITRQGAPAGINYYNIVQPQVQFGSNINQLQQRTSLLQAEASAAGPGANLSTGHPVFFGNYSHFYATRGLAGVGTYGGGPTSGGAPIQVGAGGPGRSTQGGGSSPGFPGTGGVR